MSDKRAVPGVARSSKSSKGSRKGGSSKGSKGSRRGIGGSSSQGSKGSRGKVKRTQYDEEIDPSEKVYDPNDYPFNPKGKTMESPPLTPSTATSTSKTKSPLSIQSPTPKFISSSPPSSLPKKIPSLKKGPNSMSMRSLGRSNTMTNLSIRPPPPPTLGERGRTYSQGKIKRRKSTKRFDIDGMTFLRAHPNDPSKNEELNYPSNIITTSKYTLATFLPLNLFEQFRKFSNFYFLISAVISLLPGLSPVSPLVTIGPLLFVLGLGGGKDALEDYERHKADERANSTEYTVIRKGKEMTVPSRDIVVGDILAMKAMQIFPADLVLLNGSNDEGIAYVETSNLDGETNLKKRKPLAATVDLIKDTKSAAGLRGYFEFEDPNPELYSFKGRYIGPGNNVTPITADNILLRGAMLRNTSTAYGFVTYTGVDTKLFLNLRQVPPRLSKFNRMLNNILFMLMALFITAIVVSAALSAFYFNTTVAPLHLSYLDISDLGRNPWLVFGRACLSFFVLYSYIMPLSLFVTIELVRVIQSKFMAWDLQCPGMEAKNSNINEELGQIEHIFSDKTGTLTQNVMKLAKWSVDGAIHEELASPGSLPDSQNSLEFLRCLALCHTVVPEHTEGSNEVVYQAQSPDEGALVESAVDNKVVLKDRQGKNIIIEARGKKEVYEVMATLEFNSDRKRMSVVVRNVEGGPIILYSKGADNVMFELLAGGQEAAEAAADDHLTQFSQQGLRTLVIVSRELTKSEFETWNEKFLAAQADISDNRQEILDAAMAEIEVNFKLLGCTAIEDKLQDHCAETIKFLLEAGISVWVLTGDKQETAVNIGRSTNLLTKDMDVMLLNSPESSSYTVELIDALLKATDKDADNPNHPPRGLVVDGDTLGFAIRKAPERFVKLGNRCNTIICCRVTPLQKALVVGLARKYLGRTTLAIGDGANDVSMIQEANVGVGVAGKEGTQAVRAADFAITQFSHLKRLVCVHGRYSYVRFTGLVQYSFYKNLVWIFPIITYGYSSMFSQQPLYDEFILSWYNVFWTAMPPFIYALFEKDVPEDVVMKYAKLYIPLPQNTYMNKRTGVKWLLDALFHGFVCWWIPFRALGYKSGGTPVINWSNGDPGDWAFFGFSVSTFVVFVVLIRFSLFVTNWNKLTRFSIYYSLWMYIGWTFLHQWYYFVQFWGNTNSFGVATYLWTSPSFYLTGILVMAACNLPVLARKYWVRRYSPNAYEALLEMRYVRKLQAGINSLWFSKLHKSCGYYLGSVKSPTDEASPGISMTPRSGKANLPTSAPLSPGGLSPGARSGGSKRSGSRRSPRSSKGSGKGKRVGGGSNKGSKSSKGSNRGGSGKR